MGVMVNVMSRMGRFVFECQEIAEQSASPAEVAEKCEEQFADRQLVRYATQTAGTYYGQLDSDPDGSIYEDIPF